MMKDNKTTVGTEITLILNEECLEFANEYRAREVLKNTALSCRPRSI